METEVAKRESLQVGLLQYHFTPIVNLVVENNVTLQSEIFIVGYDNKGVVRRQGALSKLYCQCRYSTLFCWMYLTSFVY